MTAFKIYHNFPKPGLKYNFPSYEHIPKKKKKKAAKRSFSPYLKERIRRREKGKLNASGSLSWVKKNLFE